MKTIQNTFLKTAIVSALVLGMFFAFNTIVDAYSGGGGDEGCCGSTPTTPTTPTTPGGGKDSSNPPSCDIRASLSVAQHGEEFLVTWSGSPASSDFWINGFKLEDANDSATYTFDGQYDYMRFTIYGENNDGDCGDEVVINKKVPGCPDPDASNYDPDANYDDQSCEYQTPAPSCDMFTASPSSIVRGGTATLAWESTNATAAAINNAIGSVDVDGTIEVSPIADTTYVLTLTADGHDPVTCDAPVHVSEVVNTLPECTSFTATPGTLPVGGGTVILDWDLLRTATAVINKGIGDVTIGDTNIDKTMSGSQTVNVTQSTTFTLTATDVDGDQTTCKASVTVPTDNPTPPQCPLVAKDGRTIVDFSGMKLRTDRDAASAVSAIVPGTFAAGSYDVTLVSWDGYTNRVNASQPNEQYQLDFLSGNTVITSSGIIGDLADNVIEATNVETVNSNYSLTLSQAATGVQAVQPFYPASSPNSLYPICAAIDEKPTVSAPTCDLFTATPSTITVGENATLTWETTNAVSVALNNGIGTDGGTLPVDGTFQVSPIASTTYVLTVSGADDQKVNCEVPVTVVEVEEPVFTCADNVSFTASDRSIDRGSNTTLNWSTTDVDSLTISGINATALSGTETVSPTSDTTYTLEATQGDQTISCPLTVDVSTGGGGGGGGSSSPRCELEISAERITAGDEIELTWESSRARELTIEDNFGNVIVTTEDELGDDKDDLFDGSITLNPTRNTTYTLVVERGSRDRECSVEVEMDDEIVLLEVRDQAPLVSGISLSQVPYTGFEAGPVMTVLFYMLLIAWALYITYVLVMPKAQLAMVPTKKQNKESNEQLMQNAEQIRPDVFAAVSAAPVVAAPANLPVADSIATMPVVAETNDTESVENVAHAQQALISSDAARTIAAMADGEDLSQTVTQIVTKAKAQFPLEDGWVVINQSRLTQITDTTSTEVSAAPTGAGSLAEAIVSGNVAAAYQLVGSRPMIALADAAADLDAVFRMKKGADASVSDLLATETQNLSEEQVADMIAALTGALDGTYTDEASAVKMAIMKAVKIAG